MRIIRCVILGFLIFFMNKSVAQVVADDSLTLISLFVNTNGSGWLIPWDTAKNVNEWYGVTLNDTNTRVQGLSLPSNQLTGSLPEDISSLTELISLDLSGNQITGKIPNSIGSLDSLIFLDLSENEIEDSIPEGIGNLKYLKTLNLSNNNLTGIILESIGNLDSLQNLNLSNNKLNGEIPNSLSNLDSLTSFDLSSNLLIGILPEYIKDFKKLIVLNLSNNQLNGAIPESLGELEIIRELIIGNNNFTGSIPGVLGGLDSLRVLNLASNELLDSIPASLSDLQNLIDLDLSYNGLVGGIPVQFGNLTELTNLQLNDNQISGIIPDELSMLSNLEILNLANNSLQDTVPSSFVNLSNLQSLDVSGNGLNTLPVFANSELANSLIIFDIHSNSFDFADIAPNIDLFNDTASYIPQAEVDSILNIPASIGDSIALSVTVEGEGNLYKWIRSSPDSIVDINFIPDKTFLVIDSLLESNIGIYTCQIINPAVPGLTLERNPVNIFLSTNPSDSLALIALHNATGGVSWFQNWNLTSSGFVAKWPGVELEGGRVVSLNLSDNNLTGSVPDSINLLSNLKNLDLSSNSLDSISISLEGLELLENLNISDNNIESGINDFILRLQNTKDLKTLDIGSNLFYGDIPHEISLLDSLEFIDLSDNELRGEINDIFSSLTKLRILDISHNNLEDSIPFSLSIIEQLRILNLSHNGLVGGIPIQFGNLTELTNLRLNDNQISGTIPGELSMLSKLEILNLANNTLQDTVPSSFVNLSSLKLLDVSGNNLNTLPVFANSELANSLTIFDIHSNSFDFADIAPNIDLFNDTASYVPQAKVDTLLNLPTSIGDSISLSVTVEGEGNLYKWFRSSPDSIVDIDFVPDKASLVIDSIVESNIGIYTCQIINPAVPGLTIERYPIIIFLSTNPSDSLALIALHNATGGTSWFQNWNLTSSGFVAKWPGVELEGGRVVGLNLSDNNLTASVPDSINLLSNLKNLDLSSNSLDSISFSLEGLELLEYLNISDNSIESGISDFILGLQNTKDLKTIDIGSNLFYGDIPHEISLLDSLEFIDLSDNELRGEINDIFSSLTKLRVLDLSDNNLRDSIPDSFSNTNLLRILKLDDNQLFGRIPPELANIDSLVILDLSENRLEGSIPEQFAEFKILEELKLSRNRLTGALPESFANPSNPIRKLFLNDNQLKDIPVFLKSQAEFLELRVFNNFLTFDDIIENFVRFNSLGREDNFLFDPQASIITLETDTLAVGSKKVFRIPGSEKHKDNKYQWFKGSIELRGEEADSLILDSISIDNSGIYFLQVKTCNEEFLEEFSDEEEIIFNYSFTLIVPLPKPDVDDPEPFCVGSREVLLTNKTGNIQGIITHWYNISDPDHLIYELPTYYYPVSKAFDTLLVRNALVAIPNFESDADTVVIISKPEIIQYGDSLTVEPTKEQLNVF